MKNKIHHFWYLLDASGSMTRHLRTVPKVMDAQVKSLSDDSKNHPGEETRVSVFMFSSPGGGMYCSYVDYECLLYDMDVLHVPSIAGLYRINGGTALCDAMVRIIGDMKMVPEKYGEHFHLLQVITDGEELHSTFQGRSILPSLIAGLPANYTVSAFTPNATGKHYLMRYGVPPGNIDIWDPAGENAMEEVAVAMASSTSSYMSTTRSGAATSVQNLFEANAPKKSEILAGLVPLTPGSYYFETVTADDLAQTFPKGHIGKFMELKARQKDPHSQYRFVPGDCYYEFSKRERIQYYKDAAIVVLDPSRNEEDVYVGEKIRGKLGLPEKSEKKEVRISPGDWTRKGYRVFIRSTSPNRKLLAGSRVLVMR